MPPTQRIYGTLSTLVRIASRAPLVIVDAGRGQTETQCCAFLVELAVGPLRLAFDLNLTALLLAHHRTFAPHSVLLQATGACSRSCTPSVLLLAHSPVIGS